MTREPATLLILAGGESKRMGFPKHNLFVDGVDILTHLHRRLGHLFVETIIVGRDIERVPPGLRMEEDRFVIRSPLVGIHAGLAAAHTGLCFVAACDMPYVEPALVVHMVGAAVGFDAVVPVVNGFHEPLCAAYRQSCIPAIERLIRNGSVKVTSFYPSVSVRDVPETTVRRCDPELRSIVNINLSAEADLIR